MALIRVSPLIQSPKLSPANSPLQLAGQVKELSAKASRITPGEEARGPRHANRFKQFLYSARLGGDADKTASGESRDVLFCSQKRTAGTRGLPLLGVKDPPEMTNKVHEGLVRRPSTDDRLRELEVVEKICARYGQPTTSHCHYEGRHSIELEDGGGKPKG